MTLLRISLAFLVLPLSALAESRDSVTVSHGTSDNYFEALSGALQVYRSQFTIERFENLDGSDPIFESGDCFGSFVILRGIPSGGGNCVFVDANGDRALQAWSIDSVDLGIGRGTWHFIGGTGAHEGISGRGYYESKTVARTGETTNTIHGTVSWPE